jgi:hypothetical protein
LYNDDIVIKTTHLLLIFFIYIFSYPIIEEGILPSSDII